MLLDIIGAKHGQLTKVIVDPVNQTKTVYDFMPQTTADMVVVNDNGDNLYEFLPTIVPDETHPCEEGRPLFAVSNEDFMLDDLLDALLKTGVAPAPASGV